MILYGSFFHTFLNNLESSMVVDNPECFFHLICPEKLRREILDRLVGSLLGELFEPSSEVGWLESCYVVAFNHFISHPVLTEVIGLLLDSIKSDSLISLIPLEHHELNFILSILLNFIKPLYSFEGLGHKWEPIVLKALSYFLLLLLFVILVVFEGLEYVFLLIDHYWFMKVRDSNIFLHLLHVELGAPGTQVSQHLVVICRQAQLSEFL